MEHLVIALFLIFFLLELIVELALNEANITYVRRHWSARMIPDIFMNRVPSKEYEKSVAYTLARSRFQRWAEIYGAAVTLLVLLGGVLPLIDGVARNLGTLLPPGSQAVGILFCLGITLVASILGLPTELYSTFVLEQRFGFNKTTFQLYLVDKLKGLVIGLIIGIPFLYGVLWLMKRSGSYWWLWAFFFIFGFQVLILLVYPTIIAPLFNKFEPLEKGELRERITTLAEQVGLKTSGIFTMDGSKRSGHSNAYFTGIGKAKRIVLFDTLLKQLTGEQLLAVLAHEMGHYKMKHIRRMLLLQGVFLLIGLYLLSWLIDFPPLFRAFGLVQPSNYAALVLFAFMAGPFTFYLNPLLNSISRKHEYEADRFAAETSNQAKAMEEALIELTVQNLSNMTPHPWYSAYHYSHPTTSERVQALRQV
ncbi:MAG: M48 family metalloprotease [Deltaproteobacteria bacterium]|nr:M48 family metalloprotease [Deltaproteobacteria bacterium]